MLLHTSLPFKMNVIVVNPPISEGWLLSTSSFQPRLLAKLAYISYKSRANRFASSPPSAPRISIMTFLFSFGSFGIRSCLSCVSSDSRVICAALISSRRSSRSVPSASVSISLAVSISSFDDLISRIHFTIFSSSLYLLATFAYSTWSDSRS